MSPPLMKLACFLERLPNLDFKSWEHETQLERQGGSLVCCLVRNLARPWRLPSSYTERRKLSLVW